MARELIKKYTPSLDAAHAVGTHISVKVSETDMALSINGVAFTEQYVSGHEAAVPGNPNVVNSLVTSTREVHPSIARGGKIEIEMSQKGEISIYRS